MINATAKQLTWHLQTAALAHHALATDSDCRTIGIESVAQQALVRLTPVRLVPTITTVRGAFRTYDVGRSGD